MTAIFADRPAVETASCIDALIREVVQHFRDEEAIIAAAGFPGAQEHAAIHRQIVERATALVARFHDRTLGIGELFQFLANDVVERHILGADRRYFPFLPACP